MVRSIFFAVAAFATAVIAQTDITTCCKVDPNSVPIKTRLSWCLAQTNTCPELCSNGQTTANTCSADTLTYNCTCLNGSPGNVSDYQQTLPAQECGEWVAQCKLAHPNDAIGLQFCLSFNCGQKTVTQAAANVTASSASAGVSSTGTAAASAASSASISASRSAAAAATAVVHFGKQYGTAALGVAGAALFGLAL